jgi:hypothetical protein
MLAKKKMSEKELAAQIQRQKGDVSRWSKRSTPAEESKEAGVVFSVRFAPSELDGIRKQANALGVTVARIIRHAVVEHSAQQTMVLDFSGCNVGTSPTMVLFGSVPPTRAMGYAGHHREFSACQGNVVVSSWGFRDHCEHLENFLIPPCANTSGFFGTPSNEPEDLPFM